MIMEIEYGFIISIYGFSLESAKKKSKKESD